MQQIKGAVLKSRMAFVQDRFGEAGLRQVRESLPAADQAALGSILTVGWYPFELGKRLDEAIVRVCGRGNAGLFKELGASSAEKNLTTLHKTFLSPGNPHAFLGRARTIYALYYETGRREYERTGDHSGVLTTRDAETFSEPDCQTVIGWYERALEMCGASDVHIVEAECRATGGKVCRYLVSWGEVHAPGS
jgi:uncharacterized protein (TIGR02265 family)